MVAYSGFEPAHRVQSSSQVLQHLSQQGGLLSQRLQSLLETWHRLLETSQLAVRHAHRQVQLTWNGEADRLINNQLISQSVSQSISITQNSRVCDPVRQTQTLCQYSHGVIMAELI